MGKIVLLDELTINQIAAGEVIERPASVIKEMLENSIDAGAKNIVVEIKKGGIELIKITDDGCGISEDDMEIAFERHATSKIRSSTDLENVKTMGFRGEALASISAISKVEMVSKTVSDEIGHKIIVEGGEVKEKSEIGCQKGTTITVENLFYNTPVRYKFLKKDYTEAGYIEDVVTRIALVNKNVSIKLINSGKTVIQTNGNNDIKTVIYSIYGKDVANGILDVNYDFENIKITGVIGKPEIARGNRGYQLFFINGRYVKDKTLTSAVDNAFKDILPIGKYAFLVLNIEMDPKMVDVNVHPAKLEVRFVDDSLIYKAVYHAIKSILDKQPISKISEDKVYNIQEKKNFEPSFTSSILEKKDKLETKNEINLKETKNIENEIEEKEEISSEDKNSEIINNEIELNSEIEPEKDIVQPKIRKSFSDLIKKVIKNDDDRVEYHQDNLVETLFEERHGKRRSTPDFSSDTNNNEKIATENFVKEENNKTKNSKSFFDIEFESEIKINQENFMEDEKEKNSKENFEDIENNTESIEVNAEEKNKTENVSDNLINEDAELNIEKEENINDINNKKQEKNIEEINNITEKDEDNTNFENIPNELEEINEETDNEDSNKNEEIEEIDNSLSGKTIKIGNVSISSDTAEISLNINDIIKNNENVVDEKEEFKEDTELDGNEIPKTQENTEEFAEMYRKTFGKDITKKNEEETENIESYNDFLFDTSNENLNVFESEDNSVIERKYTYVGNVFNSYLIIEMGNNMYIIDQRLAYERIIFEKIKESYYNESARDSQMLLLPDIIILNKKELIIANENIEMFENAGFGFEEFGENTIKLYAVPALCEKLNTKQLFIDILDGLNSVSIISKEEKEQKFISIIANKSACKAKINLDESEIIDVLNQLLSLPNPFLCSEGKQIAIKMSKIDFEKKFSRR